MKKPKNLFQTWAKNMVHYGLSAGLGQFFMNAPETSCLYQLGNFLFPAGQVDPNLWQEFSKKYSLADKVIISEEPSWQEFLDGQSELSQFTRYAFADRASFDTEALEKWQSRLPANYYLSPIDKESYECLAREAWSQDLQGDFSDFDQFQAEGGFGFLLYSDKEIVAAVSTGLVYHGALEIEIATKPAYQRQGLAKILGAQMILEAQKRSLFPLWDAHNEASKKVAESLGYQSLGPYPAYEWKGTFDQ
ncbi:GNAT family N-acetyltransferase [Streptococcus gordonii]|uniref:GNAT family N-acetyltransferase n=1 Tax=Streptococcus gordonii TaxID=1302 RepID=UPI000F673831|nr:GNAT family N-acetyltransferase [Streptococcus gordonii]MCY7134708.1 GNAT family N-acetyltransferase [Streptococcus gordonii]RSJ48016.1 ribosomal-protein-alanine N-acetyltransferase [Streptococcus gordonii]RSJ49393.1 ribosomal-protein-alanine N-acetyltransferase [Streptococcus gordonii]RSJ51466.1 ribosomal-protein-alanine N-acetyltransferase [Streptococcus gordonii]